VGQAEIAWNDFRIYPDYYSSALVDMTYRLVASQVDPHNITLAHNVHHNTIDANGGSGLIFISSYGSSYNDPLYADGQFHNLVISDNTITHVGDYAKGIQLESDGDTGGFFGTLIENNTISAQNAKAGTSRGIRTLAYTSGVTINNNVIMDFYRGVYQSYSYGMPGASGPVGLRVGDNNSITNCVFAVDNQYVDAGQNIDARQNWWGDASGPYNAIANPSGTGGPVSNNVNFSLWLTVAP
jgi:hypothetical protein